MKASENFIKVFHGIINNAHKKCQQTLLRNKIKIVHKKDMNPEGTIQCVFELMFLIIYGLLSTDGSPLVFQVVQKIFLPSTNTSEWGSFTLFQKDYAKPRKYSTHTCYLSISLDFCKYSPSSSHPSPSIQFRISLYSYQVSI